MESHKTVDNKSFYKTADISQVSGSSLNESLYIEYYCWFQQHLFKKRLPLIIIDLFHNGDQI